MFLLLLFIFLIDILRLLLLIVNFIIEALGSSTRVKQFCKYYKEIKKFEIIPFNQIVNKVVGQLIYMFFVDVKITRLCLQKKHQPEVYFVANCQKSPLDKRFVFDLTLRDKASTYVYTYQALSYDDYKAWFAI